MSDWLQEVRYSVRLLRKSPGFTAVCVLSLALGIGVNTAVLAVGKSLLLAPLPVPEPHRLAIAYWWRADAIEGLNQFPTGGLTDEQSGRNLPSNYLRQVMLMAGAGLLLGIPLAVLGSRAVRSFLFGVQPTDPWSIGVGAAFLLTVAIAAGIVPAVRAARVDPLVALRRE